MLHQVLQVVLSLVVLTCLFGGDPSDTRDLVKASLIVIFPGLADRRGRGLVAGGRGGGIRARC